MNLFRINNLSCVASLCLLSVSSMVLITPSVYGEEVSPKLQQLKQSTQAACLKFKACAQAEIAGEEDISPSMAKMLESMIGNVCDSMIDVSRAEEKEELIEPAIGCMQSLADLNCKSIEKAADTQACLDYDNAAKRVEN